MNIQPIPIDQLHDHPHNSNVMPEALFEKLVGHIAASDRYPPVIVRPHDGAHQVLDGHHRVRALRRLNRAEARCVVWDVDDDEALRLLATLNRLEGRDDPRKRAALVDRLAATHDWAALSAQLPEKAAHLKKLTELNRAPPPPRKPRALAQMPVAVHFFLMPDQKRALEARLKAIGGPREEALMKLVCQEQDCSSRF